MRIVVSSVGAESLIRLPGVDLEPESFGQLHAFLARHRRSPDVVGGLFEADHPIVIEPTNSTRWEHAMEAFNAAVRARYTNITFAPPT